MSTTSITPRATGRHDDREGTPYLVFERTFRAPDRGRLGRGDRAGAAGALDRHVGG